MKFLVLRPQVARLRRLARAHAGGEVSTRDFRLYRRQVIEEFAGVSDPGDDTVPRMPAHTLSVAGLEMEDTAVRAPHRAQLWWGGSVFPLACTLLVLALVSLLSVA